ncbi:DNA topoisomerase VI, partial [Candidatus Micrarchaeota archaeon]|nr:DNA topoisomerase VI [Candidatus Micrarchaeota archaeon]
MVEKDLKKQREQVMKQIEELGAQLLKEIESKGNPHLDIPVRGSSNVSFDEKNKKIILGDKVAHRYLFNVSHARKFMQTMLVASYVQKDLLKDNLTATLRDLYYAKKRTIEGTKEETIEEQKESDLAIVDFEVALETFRERLHLRAEPKGRMAGDVVIKDFVRDRESVIDLSKLGSGGLAIPSIVEQIEFKKVDIDYVLVAEKNAIFDRLNEDEYWRKNKCLLMTTAG